ncbi:bifunctional chorismate mutase/prephenate dehydratase [Fervidobacterium thailandense]|uniref:Bifunctional chorismate mutase/prephenate dehydratase n=1 Tax=Fervidobacterium thailandense TaxID=1008305 RepID=A0A1E3G1B1_9BACT|nr:bifunctional chorismate mutase/prephenate dehydratase [Fervidobacterium thailandense]ODN30015.1 hypothetical protein A4H02_07500 [Fervidobacterium thailandense]
MALENGMDERTTELARLREIIDTLDTKILLLLNERFEIALRIGRLKGSIVDPVREDEVLSHVRSVSNELLVGSKFAERMYASVLQRSRELQSGSAKLIGFQGEHGAYSEIAALKFIAEVLRERAVTLPFRTFEDIIDNVERGLIDYGILPVQNSLEGPIPSATYALLESDLYVVCEIVLPIRHCLLTLPETDPRNIRFVYSHPQALAQCRNFLKRLSLESVEYYDTAGAARKLASERMSNAAAIGSELAAKIYGLEVLKESIQDYPHNRTSFWILSKETRATGSKCAVTFLLEDRPGALLGVLEYFKSREVNLTRIVSLPSRSEPHVYRFFVDFETERVLDSFDVFVAGLKAKTMELRMLGLYDSLVVER